jgi:aminocarboxymuconate-semialdehyde decarboxylase
MCLQFNCRHGFSRRGLLAGGAAAAAFVASGARAQRAPRAPSDVRAIDIHAHYFPETYLDLLGGEGRQFGASYAMTPEGFTFTAPGIKFGPLPTKFIDLKQRLTEMDQQGVAMQALSLVGPAAYFADGEFSHKIARAWNDAASAAHKAHPDRFVVLAALPMLQPERAIEELDRASKLAGVRGVYLGTNIRGKNLDDPAFASVFARMDALGLPLFLHPLGGGFGSERFGQYYLGNLLGNPFETAMAASCLIFGGVLDRHPKLEVCLAHAGGALPILTGRLDHGWRVRKETKHLPNPPSSYVRRFTYDTIAHSKPIMQFVIAQVGADRVMLGSDYCFDMGYEDPVEVVDGLDIGDNERRLILGGTAARLLKV